MKNGEYNRNKDFMMDWSIYDRGSYAAYDKAQCELVESMRNRGMTSQEINQFFHLQKKAGIEDGYWDIELDMSAPEGLPDGEYTIYDEYNSPYSGEHYGEGRGAVIKDGQFEPVSTDAACYAAVCYYYGATEDEVRDRTFQIDHVYIEGFCWDPEKQMIKLTVGS